MDGEYTLGKLCRPVFIKESLITVVCQRHLKKCKKSVSMSSSSIHSHLATKAFGSARKTGRCGLLPGATLVDTRFQSCCFLRRIQACRSEDQHCGKVVSLILVVNSAFYFGQCCPQLGSVCRLLSTCSMSSYPMNHCNVIGHDSRVAKWPTTLPGKIFDCM